MNTALKTIAVAGFAALAAGCANTKTLETEVASLRNQIGTLQADVDGLKRTGTTTAQAATEAQRTAQAATSKADQALATAQAADRKVDATSESMNRMFAKSVSK